MSPHYDLDWHQLLQNLIHIDVNGSTFWLVRLLKKLIHIGIIGSRFSSKKMSMAPVKILNKFYIQQFPFALPRIRTFKRGTFEWIIY